MRVYAYHGKLWVTLDWQTFDEGEVSATSLIYMCPRDLISLADFCCSVASVTTLHSTCPSLSCSVSPPPFSFSVSLINTMTSP